MDRQARKLLLMTRAAVERAEFQRDLDRVRHSVGVPQLLRAALGTSVLGDLFGDAGHGRSQGWARAGLALLRRYKLVAATLGMLAPLVRRRRWVRRTLIGGAVLGIAFAARRWFGASSDAA